jgi:hypothetical protein
MKMSRSVIENCTFTTSPELDAARMRRQIGRLINWLDANDVNLDDGDKLVIVPVPANLLRDLIDTF